MPKASKSSFSASASAAEAFPFMARTFHTSPQSTKMQWEAAAWWWQQLKGRSRPLLTEEAAEPLGHTCGSQSASHGDQRGARIGIFGQGRHRAREGVPTKSLCLL